MTDHDSDNISNQEIHSDALLNVNDSIKPALILQTGWYIISDTFTDFKRQLDTTYKPIYPDFLAIEKDTSWYFIQANPIVTANNIIKMEIISYSQQAPALCIKLDSTGRNLFSTATSKNIGKSMAFIIDNNLINVIEINTHRTDGEIFLSMGFNYVGETEQMEQLERIKNRLEEAK